LKEDEEIEHPHPGVGDGFPDVLPHLIAVPVARHYPCFLVFRLLWRPVDSNRLWLWRTLMEF